LCQGLISAPAFTLWLPSLAWRDRATLALEFIVRFAWLVNFVDFVKFVVRLGVNPGVVPTLWASITLARGNNWRKWACLRLCNRRLRFWGCWAIVRRHFPAWAVGRTTVYVVTPRCYQTSQNDKTCINDFHDLCLSVSVFQLL